MAEPDIITRTLSQKRGFFADIFNTFLFEKKVVNPELLDDMDTTMSTVLENRREDLFPTKKLSNEEKKTFNELLAKMFGEPESDDDKKKSPPFWTTSFTKVRDLLKISTVKCDKNNIYCILGIENQTAVDSTIVTRLLVYDALTLDLQAQGQLKVEGRENKKYSNKNKLIPVYSIVIYWGEDDWSGEKNLAEMLNPDSLSLFGDEYNLSYEIKVINARKMYDKFDIMEDEDLKAISVYFHNEQEGVQKFPFVSKEVANVYGIFSKHAIDDNQLLEGGEVDMAEYITTFSQMRKDNERLQNGLEEIIGEYIEVCKDLAKATDKSLIDIIKNGKFSDDIKQACIERIEAEMVVH